MQPNTSPAPSPDDALTSNAGDTVVYVWAFEPEEAPTFIRQCQEWADKHGWPVCGAFIDAGRLLPLYERPEWVKVRELVAAGKIKRVVTRWTSLTSPIRDEPELEIADLARRGVTVEYAPGVGATAAAKGVTQ